MKKDCVYTNKYLHRYVDGRLFAMQRNRIDRHLAGCAVCRSSFDALRHKADTRRILGEIEPQEGFGWATRAGEASFALLRRLVYRPLWLALAVLIAFAGYVYIVNPLLHDPDLERLGAPTPTAVSAPSSDKEPATMSSVPPKAAESRPQATPAADPLVITITLDRENEKAGIRHLNEAMKEHALLRSMRFSDTIREISGSLTPAEISTFFRRIEGTGKVTYRRSRLAAAAGGEPLPFVMRLQTVRTASPPLSTSVPSRPPDAPAASAVARPAEPSAEKTTLPAVERPTVQPQAAAPAPAPTSTSGQ